MAENRLKGPPVEAGEERTVEITGLGHAGEGVGRIDDLAVFVPGAIPGDLVNIEVAEVKRRYGRGRILKLVRPAPERIAPPCQIAGDCGGCQLQHMDYGAQLEWKRRLVVDALTRIGKFPEPKVRLVIGMADPRGYRNKVQHPVAEVDGKIALGFYRRGTRNLVPTLRCDNSHPLCNQALAVMPHLFEKYGITAYDETSGRGLMRHVVLRVSTARNQLMVILVTNGEAIPRVEKLLDDMSTALPELVSVAQNVNRKRTNVIMGESTELLWGEPYIIEELNGLLFAVSPLSFFQINSQQAAVLCQKVVEYAQVKEGSRAVDCYCGTGSIALHLARAGAQVVGVEVVPEAIIDAKLNVRLNQIEGADFRMGRVETLLPEILSEGPVDVAVLDPPRKGCEPEVLDALVEARIPRLVYVSCNPSSLARDLAVLARGGYELAEVQPIDMFPHTSHVETVALMSRL
ncbi:MAG: 23S rRNA (uracil(1939)-C(5))-methyltransferase RlmD [Firmicutes bacterium]|nr:23S rRNA (uracil(1939)-C(5))-methyltransferase RlmD [Bacillota bacterium]